MTGDTSINQASAQVALRHAGASDVGRRRQENEDAYGIIEGQGYRIYLVADGMGGAKGGAIASNLAISSFEAYLKAHNVINEFNICNAFLEANRKIFERGASTPMLAGMGTTLVALAFVGTSLYIANVGDSRAYRIRNGQITRLTEDHTLVMELLKTGAIGINQAANHPVSHMLTRSLGPTPYVDVDCRLCRDGPARGDIYIICSDGLYNGVTPEEMVQTIGADLDTAARELIDLSNQKGGSDNITIQIIQLGPEFPITADEFPEAAPASPELVAKDLEFFMLKDGTTRPHVSEQSNGDTPSAYGSQQHFTDSANGADSRASRYRSRRRGRRQVLLEDEIATGYTDDIPDEGGHSPLRKMSLAITAGFLGGGLLGAISFAILSTKTGEPIAKQERSQVVVSNLPVLSEESFSQGNPAQPEEMEPVENIRTSRFKIEDVQKRIDALQIMQAEMDRKLSAFDLTSPASLFQLREEDSVKLNELRPQIDSIREEIDAVTRKLAVWYGRWKNLQERDPIDLASEVAVTSPETREKKENFEHSTWDYLREAEALKYHPGDAEQAKKVSELLRERSQRMRELGEAVRVAIKSAIEESEGQIADLTLKRDNLELQLKGFQSDIEFIDTLTGADQNAKELLRKQVLSEKAVISSELKELLSILDGYVKSVPLPGTDSNPQDAVN